MNIDGIAYFRGQIANGFLIYWNLYYYDIFEYEYRILMGMDNLNFDYFGN